ncbi:MAG: RNA polymerase sigma factor [Candidatus Melainabacteria bacterium]|nr:RNA polymerase sigma factor [Candidatus Melainabacteria bacterium]
MPRTPLLPHILPAAAGDATTPPSAHWEGACLQGDANQFRQVVQAWHAPVYRYLYRLTQNPDLSDELTQEVFLKVYQHRQRFQAGRPFRPWIFRIASNTLASAMRKKAIAVTSLDALQETGAWAEPPQPGSETTGPVEEAPVDIQQALQTLEDKYQQVLLLRYQQDCSYEEIANSLAVPINTVRTWIKRGLEKLKQAALLQQPGLVEQTHPPLNGGKTP